MWMNEMMGEWGREGVEVAGGEMIDEVRGRWRFLKGWRSDARKNARRIVPEKCLQICSSFGQLAAISSCFWFIQLLYSTSDQLSLSVYHLSIPLDLFQPLLNHFPPVAVHLTL
jgi:hypothetical protein